MKELLDPKGCLSRLPSHSAIRFIVMVIGYWIYSKLLDNLVHGIPTYEIHPKEMKA